MSSDPINDLNKFVGDHRRLQLGMLTGGMSEQLGFLKNEAELGIERMMPEEPDLEKPGAPPTMADPAVAAARNAAGNSARRGRASTILTSPQTAANLNLNLSRRTLMGK